jgi:hypothetical protein
VKVRAALANVDPKVKNRILAAGLGEILQGHLLVSSGATEIAEAALALNFKDGINAVGTAQLTPTGQRQLAQVIGSGGTPLETRTNELASVTVALQPGTEIKNTKPTLGTYLNGLSFQQFTQALREAGSMAWPALFAKPTGLSRRLVADASIPGVVGNLAQLPQDLSLEILAFDPSRGPAFRWQAHVSNDTASAWWNLVRMVAHMTTDSKRKEVRQQQRADGTWITWTHGATTSDDGAPAQRRNDVLSGTFAVAHVDLTKLAARWAQLDPDNKPEDVWLRQLLQRLGPIDASVRLQGSWLMAEMRSGLGKPSTARELVTPAADTAVEPAGTAPSPALEQAIAEASELLKAFAQVSDRAAVLSEGRTQLQGTLERLKGDPSTRADAVALDRMLLEIETRSTQPLEFKRVSDATRVQCGNHSCLVGQETCCGNTTDKTDTGAACVATVPPGKGDHVQLLASQIEACEQAKLPTSTLARCDESRDCRNNEACCENYLYSGAGANFCVPIQQPSRSPCPINEVCIEGSPCRAPGSVCINGTCQKVVGSLPCGTATCTPPKNVCCLDAMSCAAPSECRVGALHCAHHSDCLKGQFCEISVLGTQCTGHIAWGVAGSVCEKDADCGPDVFCKQNKPRCLLSEFPGVRYCGCE